MYDHHQGTAFAADGPVPLSTDFATVKFSETSVTVHPGQTQQITVHITPPTGVDPSVLPVFSGFIQVESATETLHVTYLGVAASLKNAVTVDTTDGVTIREDIHVVFLLFGPVGDSGPQRVGFEKTASTRVV